MPQNIFGNLLRGTNLCWLPSLYQTKMLGTTDTDLGRLPSLYQTKKLITTATNLCRLPSLYQMKRLGNTGTLLCRLAPLYHTKWLGTTGTDPCRLQSLYQTEAWHYWYRPVEVSVLVPDDAVHCGGRHPAAERHSRPHLPHHRRRQQLMRPPEQTVKHNHSNNIHSILVFFTYIGSCILSSAPCEPKCFAF